MISALCAWQVCRHAVQDYACLGYPFPAACLAPSCQRTLSATVVQAMAMDCRRQSWPRHCLAAGLHQVRIEFAGE